MAEVGGIDSSIPLGLHPQGAPGAGGSNPLSMIGNFAEIQGKLNQNALFAQTFAARKKAGQIMATAPSLEEGLAMLQKDPLVAPFAGEMVNLMRQGMLAQAQYQGEVQTQSSHGLEAILKGGAAGIADPDLVGPAIKMHLSTLSPMVQERLAPAVDTYIKALTDNLPTDPAARRDAFMKRTAGLSIASGTTPDTIRGISGGMAPETKQVPYGPGGAEVTMQQGGPAYRSGANPMLLGQGPSAQTNPLLPGGAPAPAAPLRGPTLAEKPMLEAKGAAQGEIIKDMSDMGAQLPQQITRMDKIISTLQDFQSGGGADLRASAGKALQALKNIGFSEIDQKTIDNVANGSLKGVQEYNALIKQFVTRQLSQDVKGQGRSMRPEVDAYLASLNETTDPAAILGVLNQIKSVMKVGFDQTKAFSEFKGLLAKKDPSVAGKDIEDFYNWYNEKIGLDLDKNPGIGVKGLEPATKPKAERKPLDQFLRR